MVKFYDSLKYSANTKKIKLFDYMMNNDIYIQSYTCK